MSTSESSIPAALPAGSPEPRVDEASPRVAEPGARHAARRSSRLRRIRWSLVASLGIHGAALAALLSAYLPARLIGEGGLVHRIEVAQNELLDEAPELEEPEPDIAPPDEPEMPELVPEEYEPVPQPVPQEEPPPELDESFELSDPFRSLKIVAWPAPPPPPAAEPAPAPPPKPREVVATPPKPKRAHVPVVVHSPRPSYPRSARRLGLEGSVRLRAYVRKDGSVSRVTIVESSGHEVLDEEAREKLEEWRFREWQPGEPEARTYLKTFNFQLPR